MASTTPVPLFALFAPEECGFVLFESVTTNDPTALIGLPLIALCAMLREESVSIP